MEEPILMNLGNTNIPFYNVFGQVANMGEMWKQSMSSVRVDFSATDKLKTGSHLHLNLFFFPINKKIFNSERALKFRKVHERNRENGF